MSDTFFMETALQLAEQAASEGEVPVGAVVVCQGKIIGKGYNQTQKLHDVTAHAEMLAITAASSFLQSKYLTHCTLFVSLEPCLMCAGAIAWSQMGKLVFGAKDEKKGFTLLNQLILHPKTEVISGIMAEESRILLQDFFQNLRN
ncbi:MAG: nucleoside deaminase [Verrucomicrobia bacterium]|nr:nucleoside deaminase [Cytophagales bacterium]